MKYGNDYPATWVKWHEAVEFCRKLSKQEGVEYRLPTEAEWEYDCRAGTTTVYSFGDDSSKLGQHAWHSENTRDTGENYAHAHAHGTGQKLPNPWGLYDMHGNVFEWCQDWYAPYGSEKAATDPIGPAQGHGRVLRGGAFLSFLLYECESAGRSSDFFPNSRSNVYGFRVARTYP